MQRFHPVAKRLAWAACWIFGGYNGIQQFLISIFRDLGKEWLASASLAIVYIVMGLGPVYMGWMIKKLRYARRMACVGIATYIIFILAALSEGPLMLVGAMLLGIGAVCCWTSVPCYIEKLVDENKGSNLGIFYIGAMVGSIFGTMIVAALVSWGVPMWAVLLCCALGPTIGMLLLIKLPTFELQEPGVADEGIKKLLMSSSLMRMLVFINIVCGVVIGSNFSNFPSFIERNFGKSDVAWFIIAVQVAIPIMMWIGGKLADRFAYESVIKWLVAFLVISPVIMWLGRGEVSLIGLGAVFGIIFTAGTGPAVTLLALRDVKAKTTAAALIQCSGPTGIMLAMLISLVASTGVLDGFTVATAIIFTGAVVSMIGAHRLKSG